MAQRGVVPPSENIISQLRAKFPRRKNQVSWPDKDRIEKLRNLTEKIVCEMDVDECEDMSERLVSNPEDEYRTHYENCRSLSITISRPYRYSGKILSELRQGRRSLRGEGSSSGLLGI